MPNLDFSVISAEVQPYAAAPALLFKLRVTSDEPVESVMLHCQVRIEPRWRPYGPEAQARLFELFGPAGRWPDSLHSLLWAQTNLVVQRFTGETIVDLCIPCTYDFEVASAKYFQALASGGVPLSLLFSGTIFHLNDGDLQIAQVSWEKEAQFRLPVALWHEAMDRYFPNTAWLRLQTDVFERLCAYKRERALPTWEAAIGELLSHSVPLPSQWERLDEGTLVTENASK